MNSLSMCQRAKIGCVAGLVGGFAIFVSVFIIDLSLGSTPGTFYKVIGLPAGMSGIEATLLGMISHMCVASIIGTIFGLGSKLHTALEIGSVKKGAISGIVTGVVVFLVFFIPINTFVMMPLIHSSKMISDAQVIVSNDNLIMIGSLELHVVYGVVMGVFFAMAAQSKNKLPLTQLEA